MRFCFCFQSGVRRKSIKVHIRSGFLFLILETYFLRNFGTILTKLKPNWSPTLNVEMKSNRQRCLNCGLASKSHLIYIRFLSCNNGPWFFRYTLQCEDSNMTLAELESFCFPNFLVEINYQHFHNLRLRGLPYYCTRGRKRSRGMIPHVPPKKIFFK